MIHTITVTLKETGAEVSFPKEILDEINKNINSIDVNDKGKVTASYVIMKPQDETTVVIEAGKKDNPEAIVISPTIRGKGKAVSEKLIWLKDYPRQIDFLLKDGCFISRERKSYTFNVQNKPDSVIINISKDFVDKVGISNDSNEFEDGKFKAAFLKVGYNEEKRVIVVYPFNENDDDKLSVKLLPIAGDYGRISNKQLHKWLMDKGFAGKIYFIFDEEKNAFISVGESPFPKRIPISKKGKGRRGKNKKVGRSIHKEELSMIDFSLSDINWFEKKERVPTIRITANLSSFSGRISFNSLLMKEIPDYEYVKIGYVEKPDGKLITFAKMDKPGEDIHSLVKTPKSKGAAINIKDIGKMFSEKGFIGLYKAEYREDLNLWYTGEKISERDDEEYEEDNDE